MGLTNETLPKIHQCFKFNEKVSNMIKTCEFKEIKQINIGYYKGIRKMNKFISKIMKLCHPIPDDVIKLFYDNPDEFFASFERLLKNTTFYEDGGNSIFVHYFFVLYDLYQNNSGEIEDNIYEKNFNSFFIKEAQYLYIQDFNFETPLHKIAKFRDKKFFLKICKKLKDINVLTEELLLINNINGESCFHYILQAIRENKNKIIKNDFELYQQFINYFPNCINYLSLEDQKLFVKFSCLIVFEDQKWKDINFNDTIKSLYNLKEKKTDILNIFRFLYYPYESGLNYLNCLYHSCKNNEDFEKLFQLVLDLTKISKDNKLCISAHASYVLRKMNSTKLKGETEVKYGTKLVNEIIPLLIQGESDENILNIVSVRTGILRTKSMNFNTKKGICSNLVNNPNLSFDQKFGIFSLIKEKLGKFFGDIVEEEFLYLYKLFDAYNKKEINEENINIKFKENIFVQKIFNDFYYIGELYREVYKTWRQFQQMSINEYISSLTQFINNNYLDIFGKYSIRYNFSKEGIYIITRLIIAYEKQNYSNNTENDYILKNFHSQSNKHKDNFLLLYKKFMQSKPQFTNILLKMLNTNKFPNKLDYLTIFFSFNYDYEIIFTDENIINEFKETFFRKDINKKKYLRLYGQNTFLKKFKASIISSRDKPHESLYAKFILTNFPLKQVFINEISKFKILMKNYMKSLIYNWEKECDFSELKKFINENIIIFCFLFSTENDSKTAEEDKIYFFFDEFIKALDSNSKEKYLLYKDLALEYIEYWKKTDIYFNLDSKYYLSLWLIFVRLKFGKYNPQVLILFLSYYKETYKLFLNFLVSYFKTEYKPDIIHHYFFSDDNLASKDEYLVKLPNIIYTTFYNGKITTLLYRYLFLFLSKYIHKLLKIENSFIFYFILKILKQLKSDLKNNNEEENGEEDEIIYPIIEIDTYKLSKMKPELYKLIILGINENQDARIYTLIMELFFNGVESSISLYSFLDIEPNEFNNGAKISHNINILKQLSKDLEEKTKTFKGENIEKYLYKEKCNDNTLVNLYWLLFVLKNEDETLLNCVKTNKFLVLNTFYILLINYFLCLAKIYKGKENEKEKENEENNMPSLEEIYEYIFDEINNFVYFFNKNENKFYENNDELSISRCLLYINFDLNYRFLIHKFVDLMKKIKSQIFYNDHNEYNLNELIEILNKDIFAFSSFLFSFYDEFYIKNKEEYKHDENNEINNIITFLFNQFLDSVNPNLKNKYELFQNLYHDVISIEFNLNQNNETLLKCYDYTDYYLSCFIMYIYSKKLYPNNNSKILLYLLNTRNKEFLKLLNNCMIGLNPELNKEMRLFLEDVAYDTQKIKMTEKACNISPEDQLFNLIINNLIDFNYSSNSYAYDYIFKILRNQNKTDKKEYLSLISLIISNYNPPEDKGGNNNNKKLYNELMELFCGNFTFYGFLNEDYILNINNRERMIKKIKIIENLIKYSSNIGNVINLTKSEFCEKFLQKDNFLNLYAFLSELKSQNKKLIKFANKNAYFIKETIKLLVNINDLMKNSSVIDCAQDWEIKMKSDFIKNEIKEFFDDLIHDENNRNYLLQCEFNENRQIKINNLFIELAWSYNKAFVQPLVEGNISKSDLNKKYKEFRNSLLFVFEQIKQVNEVNRGKKISNKGKIIRKIKINDFTQTLGGLFQNDIDKFCDFLEIILKHFNTSKKEEITKIITSIMKANIQIFFNYFSKIKSTISKIKEFDVEKEMDTIPTVEFILNNADYNIYSKLDIINNSSIYQDAQKGFMLLSQINNQKASLFVYKQLKEFLDKDNNIEKFIEFINNNINNNLVFDYLLSWLKENEIQEIFKDNKEYQKIVISSLFRYSTINGYYIIKKLLTKLSKYMHEKDFQSIIYSPLIDPRVSPIDYELENIFIEDDVVYLLTYSLSNKCVPNYETIAVILGFCKFPQGILKLFEFLNIGLNLDFSNFKSFNFFSGIKDREKIKDLEINFYNLIVLYESIISNYDILKKYSDMEKFMFNNIIKIFILDITPRELMILTDVNMPEGRLKDVKNDEIKIFILLALFEIKGLPILPIRKYYPSFFSKIEEFFNKIKSFIKITPICLKQNSDVKLYEKLKLLIKDKSCD